MGIGALLHTPLGPVFANISTANVEVLRANKLFLNSASYVG